MEPPLSDAEDVFRSLPSHRLNIPEPDLFALNTLAILPRLGRFYTAHDDVIIEFHLDSLAAGISQTLQPLRPVRIRFPYGPAMLTALEPACFADDALVATDHSGFIHVVFPADRARDFCLNNGASTWGITTHCTGPFQLAVSANSFTITVFKLRLPDLPPLAAQAPCFHSREMPIHHGTTHSKHGTQPSSKDLMALWKGAPLPPVTIPPPTELYPPQLQSEPQKWYLRGHQHNIPNIEFSPCGTALASVSIDKTLRVWDLSALEELPPGSTCSDSTSMELCADQWAWCCRWMREPARSVPMLVCTTQAQVQIVAWHNKDKSAARLESLLAIDLVVGPILNFERIIFLEYIPELSMVVFANQARPYVIAMTLDFDFHGDAPAEVTARYVHREVIHTGGRSTIHGLRTVFVDGPTPHYEIFFFDRSGTLYRRAVQQPLP